MCPPDQYESLAHLSEREKIERIVKLEARVAELEAENALNRRILANLPDLVNIFDIDAQRNVYENRSFDAHFGYQEAQSDAKQHDFYQIIHPDDVERFSEVVQQVTKSKGDEVFTFEYRFLHGDGTWRYIQSRDVVLTRDEDGRPKQTLGVARDLTDHLRQKEHLQKSEYNFRTLAEHSPDLIARVNRDFRYTYVNKAFADNMRMPQSELIGIRTDATSLSAETKMMWKTKRQHVFETGEPLKLESTIYEAEHVIHYQALLIPEFDEAGEVVSVLSLTRDISDLKVAQIALEDNRANLHSLVENIQHAVWSVDRNYNLIISNKQLLDIYYSLVQVMLKPGDNILDPLDEERRAYWRALYDRGLQGERFQFEYRDPVKADAPIYAIAFSPIRGTDQQIEGVTVFVEDITERTRNQNQLEFQASALANIQEAVIAVDNDFCVTYLNRAASKQYDLDLEECIGKPLEVLYHSEWYDPADGEQAMADLQVHGHCFTALRHKKQDGMYLDVEATTTLLKDTNGQQIGLLAVIRDVTDRRKLEQLYRALVNQSLLGFSVLDKNGQVIFANPALERITGYSRAELMQMSGDDSTVVFAPIERAGVSLNREKRLRGEEVPSQYEVQFLRKDGRSGWVEMSLSTGEYNGEMVIFCATLDITERRRIQEQLKEQERLYRLIADNTTDIITLSDAQGRVMYASPSSESQLGYTAEERLGKPTWEIIHPDDLDALLRARSEYLRSDTGLVEYRIRHKNGHYLWMETSVKVLRDAQGKVESILGITRQIDDRKQTELFLRENQHFIQNVADTAPYIIYVYDYEKGHDVYLNRYATRFFNRAQEKVHTMTTDLIAASYHPDDLPVALAKAEEVKISPMNKVTTFDARMKNAAGEWRWLRFRVVPFKFSDNGVLQQTLGLCMDITDQREAEQRAFKLALEQEKVRFLTEFIVSASHEFRTPLSVINTSLYLLKRQNNLPDDYPYVVRIHERVEDILQLVDAITTFAHLEREVPKFKPVSIERLLGDIVAGLSVKAEKMNVTVHLSPATGIPTIEADEQNVMLLLQKIVDNAIQFNIEGGEVFIHSALIDERYCMITVRDTGVGIAMDVQDHLYESFYRVDPARTTRGFGLGLAIAKIIVEQHQGEIHVESEVGRGTTFSVRLPLKQG